MDVVKMVSDRLDESRRGDRGWFITTRVHVDVSWITAIAKYLFLKARSQMVSLTDIDYARIGEIIGSTAPDPGVAIRRHNLLVMAMPLQLIERPGRRWEEFRLTKLGCMLAETDDPRGVLEEALKGIIFARTPSTPPDRVAQYPEFNVAVYLATARLLSETDGWIDRDEFDFFVSRMRTMAEVSWAKIGILELRRSAPSVRRQLQKEVAKRIAGTKVYQNWRDMGPHTFSLFALGTGMVRQLNKLYLTKAWAERSAGAAEYEEPPNDYAEIAAAEDRPEAKVRRELKVPELSDRSDANDPPAPLSNDGSDGESFVAKILRAEGWNVIFFTRMRGYGFDLWARKASKAMYVEVKSSVGRMSTLGLTQNELDAAKKYREQFVLAVAENLSSAEPLLHFISDPAKTLKIVETKAILYSIVEADWRKNCRHGY